MKSNINQLKAGSILSYLQMFCRLIIGLFYTPLMLRLLGQNEYGLYNTVSSTIGMLSILTLGFNSSYIRYYSKYQKENNQDAIHRLNGLYLLIFSGLGLIVMACGLFLTTNLTYVFDEGLTASEYEIARVLMILMTVNLALSFPASVFTSIISAQQKFIVLKLLGIIKTVLVPLLCVPVLLMGYRSIAIVVMSVVLTLVTDLLYVYYVFAVLKQKFVFRGFESGLFKSLFGFTLFITINMIVEQINNNMDKFLLARYQGTATVAIYSLGSTLYLYYMMFSQAISGVFAPRVHRLVLDTAGDVPRQRQELTALFTKVGRIQFLILALLASGIIFFGKPFIHVWAGDGYEESYYVALLLILPSTIALMQNIGIDIQQAQNRHQFRSIAYLLMAMVNLGLTLLLCQRYGAVGAAVGTALSLLLANGLMMNIYYHKRCNIHMPTFWKNILRLSLGLIPPMIVGILLHLFVAITSVWMLLVCIIGYSAVYVISMWLFGMNRFEKELITKPLKRMFRK